VSIAGKYDIICDQGSTFERTFVYRDSTQTPIDNTGWSARMQVRPTFGSDEVLLNMTTQNNTIVLGGSNGEIFVSSPDDVMANLESGVFVYDLELITPTSVIKPVRGSFTIRPEVTR
jgi:hypothetical protein